MPFYYYYDPTYSLVLIGLLLCLAASARVRSTYAKYGRAVPGSPDGRLLSRFCEAQGSTMYGSSM